MRGVISSALRCRATGKLAQDGHKRRVKNRNEQYQDRNREDRQKTSGASTRYIDERGARQEESDKHRAAVAHEDRSRIRVVNQKAQQRRGKNRQRQSLSRLPADRKADGKKARSDRCDSDCESVHVVE